MTFQTAMLNNDFVRAVYAADTTSICGDVNKDGTVNVVDMIKLKSYLLGNKITISDSSSDVDGDGKITATDAVELSMYLTAASCVFTSEKTKDSDGDGLYK